MFAFVRTRTYYREYDYRLLTPVTSLPAEIQNHFSRCVNNLINDSASEWDKPTWLLIKHGNYLLWGLAVNNNIFSEECCEEEVGRRRVRCFCGVVINISETSTIRLPYEVKAFQPIFDRTVAKAWMERVYEIPDVLVEFGEYDFYIEPGRYVNDLNMDNHICRLFPSSTNSMELLSAALTANSDMSVAVNVLNSSQVCDPSKAIPILNAIMRNASSTTDLPVRYKCKQCGQLVEEVHNGLCNSCREPRGDTPIVKPEPITAVCNKCGEEVLHVDDNGYCNECSNRARKRKFYTWGAIAVLILLLLLTKGCSPFMSCPFFMKHDRNELSPRQMNLGQSYQEPINKDTIFIH